MTIITTRRPGKQVRSHHTSPTAFRQGFQNPYNTESLPKTNIIEREGSWLIHMAVPGMKREDIQIELDNDLLVVSAKENKRKSASNGLNFLERGFDYSGFKRSFEISKNIDPEDISASVKNGILEITLRPKKKYSKTIKVG